MRFIPPIHCEETTWSLIAPRTRFHPSGAPVAAGAVLLCQSHGCFYFPRWRSPCRPGLSRSQHTAHCGRTAFAAPPAAGAHSALRDRCCCSDARRSLARRWRRGALRCCWHARHRRRPPSKRPVVSQDARLFSWRALRYAAGTASGAAAYARLEQTGRAAVGRESGARGARKGTHRRFLDARRTPQRAHRAPSRKKRGTRSPPPRARRTLALQSGGGGLGAIRSDSLIFVLDAGRFRHALRGLHTREHRSRSVPRGRGVGRQIGDQAKMRRCAQIASARRVAAPHTLNMYSVLVAATAMIFCEGREAARHARGGGSGSGARGGVGGVIQDEAQRKRARRGRRPHDVAAERAHARRNREEDVGRRRWCARRRRRRQQRRRWVWWQWRRQPRR